MSSIVEKIISNLLLASVIPSFIFVILVVILFPPAIVGVLEKITSIMVEETGSLKSLGVFIMAASFLLGLTLLYLVETIFWLYRGEFLPKWCAIGEIERFDSLRNQIDNLQLQHLNLYKSIPTEKILEITEWDALKEPENKKYKLLFYFDRYVLMPIDPESNQQREKLNNINNKKYKLQSQFDRSFPPKRNLVVPTQFGNILAAAETYPSQRYGINDAPSIYIRLLSLSDNALLARLDDTRTQTAFLVFLSLLMGILSILLLSVDGYLLIKQQLANQSRLFIQYLFYSLFFIGLSWVLYKLSLPNLKRYCDCYRSVFDLYRFELLKQLHIELPPNDKLEKYTWLNICERISFGEVFGECNTKFSHNFPSLTSENGAEVTAKPEENGKPDQVDA